MATVIHDDTWPYGSKFTKEILKAVYQYENLLSRLKGLKKKNEE